MLTRLRTYASFVRFSHSVFALPFAIVGALLAVRYVGFDATRLVWIVLCMVTARSAAMGFNRLVDAAYDARNPRTAMRDLPRGRMGVGEARWFVAIMALLFVLCAWQLGTLTGLLSPVALAIVFWYSLAKRYTNYTQAFLGLAMAVAPVGGWIAMGGPASPEPWLLGLAIGTWVAGFDILYACQDVEFDRREGLFSIPVRYGIARSLTISRVLHGLTVLLLALVGGIAGLGPIYAVGVIGVGVLLMWEQSLVRPDDLSQVARAFDVNGWVGIAYLVTTAVAVFVR
jgi:4-hydroxybenzoate polyprenyltransferase